MSCVSRLPNYFQLREGESVFVPPWFKRILQDSINASQFPDTPKFLLFEQTNEDFYTFVDVARDKAEQVKSRQYLFVPGDLRVGDVLTIEWVNEDRRSAKAVHKKDYREAATEPESKPVAPDYVAPNYQV